MLLVATFVKPFTFLMKLLSLLLLTFVATNVTWAAPDNPEPRFQFGAEFTLTSDALYASLDPNMDDDADETAIAEKNRVVRENHRERLSDGGLYQQSVEQIKNVWKSDLPVDPAIQTW